MHFNPKAHHDNIYLMNDIEQKQSTIEQNPFTRVTTLSKILTMILLVVLPFVGFYMGVKYQKSLTIPPSVDVNKKTLTTPTAPSQNKYGVSLTFPSSPGLEITSTSFGEKWRENQMYIMILDKNIAEGMNMAWAEIRIVVIDSGGENLNSFVKNHSEDYIRGLFQSIVYYDPNKVTQTTRWDNEVYTYAKTDFQDSPGTKSTLYILRRGNEFILINVYINNESENMMRLLIPFLIQ